MSFSGFGPTELRILLAIGTIALFNDPHVDLGALGRMRLFDFGGLIAIAGMVVTLAVGVFRNTTALAKLEPRIKANREEREGRDVREVDEVGEDRKTRQGGDAAAQRCTLVSELRTLRGLRG
jgi:hypothetical protein